MNMLEEHPMIVPDPSPSSLCKADQHQRGTRDLYLKEQRLSKLGTKELGVSPGGAIQQRRFTLVRVLMKQRDRDSRHGNSTDKNESQLVVVEIIILTCTRRASFLT